ncbi:MAG: hypothetical protein JWP97_230, partial [Labilithrix sp.]|nr:hypothetical protein [Labilithrix sp.]
QRPGAEEPAPAPAPARAPATATREDKRETVTQDAPQRGGCASCDAGGATPGDASAVLLGMLGVARLLRGRRRR